MFRICQVFRAFFAISPLFFTAAVSLGLAADPVLAPRIEVVTWSARSFASVSAEQPDLAACFLLAPGTWPLLKTPRQGLDPHELGRVVESHLEGLLEASPDQVIVVVQAGVERNAASAVAHGSTVLLMLPEIQTVDAQQVGGVVAEAIVASRLGTAVPDERCSEPLLGLAEALAQAGVLALAGLPPALRPVSDWIEPREARGAIEALAREVLDEERPWANRRAALAQASRAGNLRPKLAHAAAMLVESCGNPRSAVQRPFDLLVAWRAGSRGKLPAMPGVLKKALRQPLRAGLPDDKDRNDTAAIAATATDRALQTGTLSARALPASMPAEVLLRLAAQLRATGSPGLCGWLNAASLPVEIRTGCRDEEPAGVVFARPRQGGGFDVVWRGTGRQESLLLRWPKWLLFPRLGRDNTLYFIDEQGIWELPLDGSTPRLRASGKFCQLTLGPDGRTLAAAFATRPVTLLLPSGQEPSELGAASDGGLAFLDTDVLAVGHDGWLDLASAEGALRTKALEVRCVGSLAAHGTELLAAVLPPCEPGLYRVNIAEGSSTLALKLVDGPAGITVLLDGTVVIATPDGLWRWREGSSPERFTAGLTPGPG